VLRVGCNSLELEQCENQEAGAGGVDDIELIGATQPVVRPRNPRPRNHPLGSNEVNRNRVGREDERLESVQQGARLREGASQCSDLTVAPTRGAVVDRPDAMRKLGLSLGSHVW